MFARLAKGLAALALGALTLPDQARADLQLDARLAQAKVLQGTKSRIYLKLNLKGLPIALPDKRPPLNIALVIDRSGSMAGARIERAKEAALLVIERLKSDDIVSVVMFDHAVETIVPAAKMRDQESLSQRIRKITPGGRTAIYAGVEEGLRQVQKFQSASFTNRVILLSDGLANVGPSTPADLADLGRRAGSLGIPVTTIGLGLDYNEDLMTRLALASDGNHAFVEKPDDLARIFRAELGDALSTVAQEIEIEIRLKQSYKPIRILGREAKIEGDRVRLRMGQLAAEQEKYIILELEGQAEARPGAIDIAEVTASYHDPDRKQKQEAAKAVKAEIAASQAEVEASTDREVMSAVTIQIATEESERAVTLRDKGQIEEARKVLEKNAAILKKRSEELAPKGQEPKTTNLGRLSDKYEQDAKRITSQDWDRNRKALRADQLKEKNQQSY
jgi:Ca-activated chloride channel family protein